MMYADDLIIFLDGKANRQLPGKIWKVVSCFGQFFLTEGQLEQNGSDCLQLWGLGVGEVLWRHWGGRQELRQVPGSTLREYMTPSR